MAVLQENNRDVLKHSIVRRPALALLIIFGGLMALALAVSISISLGAANISLSTVWEAVFKFNPQLTHHQIIYDLRIPRVLVGALVGAGFAVAGSIMQGMTRNPLVNPSIMGINAGAALAISIAFSFFPGLSYTHLIMISFLGAALGTSITYFIGSMAKGGLTPVRLALAGTFTEPPMPITRLEF